MKGKCRRIAFAVLCLWALTGSVFARELVPVGQVVGLELRDNRVVVAGFHDILGKNCKNAGMEPGDILIKIDDDAIFSAEDVKNALEKSDGTVKLQLNRRGRAVTIAVQPEITRDGPKLGLFLRQGITGIGTVTWYDPRTGAFGTLGHGVNNSQGQLLPMAGGNAYRAGVMSVKKGVCGQPGQLMGSVTGTEPVGELRSNTARGLFGRTDRGWEGNGIPVAETDQVRTGSACIRCTVSGGDPREYSVEILKIYAKDRSSGRNLLIKVTDPRLLEITGGIVQGMSGSPIIQDGRLIGAVTHVLVNDPTTGYGILIENMLDAAS